MQRLVSGPYFVAFLGSFASLALACGLLISLGKIDNGTKAYYQTLSAPTPPSFSLGRKAIEESHHERRGVRRDFLRQNNGNRLAMRLQADKAELTLECEANSLHESLYHLDAWVQENVTENPAEQSIRYFHSNQATYSYHEDLLLAQDVILSEIKLPSTTFPEDIPLAKPSYEFHAIQIEMPLRSREKEWKAQGIQGQLSKVCSGGQGCSQE